MDSLRTLPPYSESLTHCVVTAKHTEMQEIFPTGNDEKEVRT